SAAGGVVGVASVDAAARAVRSSSSKGAGPSRRMRMAILARRPRGRSRHVAGRNHAWDSPHPGRAHVGGLSDSTHSGQSVARRRGAVKIWVTAGTERRTGALATAGALPFHVLGPL